MGLPLNPDRGRQPMSHKTLIAIALAATLSLPAERGMAQETESLRVAGPIQNGIKHQPTRGDVGSEFSRSQQEETDRLYNELMSNSSGGTRHTGIARMR
jgi:hypothetical protein